MRILALGLLLACGGPEMVEPHSIKTFPGLCASRNTVGDALEGSAEIMDNMVLRKKNTPEPRPGGKASAATSGPINALAFKEGQAVALIYDTPSNTGTLCAYNPATNAWTTLPMNPGGLTMDRPGISGAHTRFVSANKALYFQSKYGLTKVETLASGVSRIATNTRILAGSPASQYSVRFISPSIQTTSTWLANNFQVGYRVTLARKGANGELIESEPSDQVIISNTSGGARSVRVTLKYGWLVQPDSFFRVYRTKSVATGTDPSPEMFLVNEALPLTGASVTTDGFFGPGNSSLAAEDVTPDSQLTIPLYTNPYSGSGLTSGNASSPLSFDLAWFKSRMHHLNTTDVQRLTVRVIGTGTGGINDGDWINVNGATFTFTTNATDALNSLNHIFLYTAGTVAQNIENTAREIGVVVNFYFTQNAQNAGTEAANSQIAVYYLSAGSPDAGLVVLQSVVPGSQAFTFKTSSSSGWGSDYTKGVTSDPNTQIAGWSWSNISQPEGVPTLNNNPIGDRTAAGQRLIALKETMFAFKQDGLWKITDDGSALGPQLQLMDPTVRLVAPESAVALDNFILALADQGVILVTETGAVLNISHTQIEQELFKLMAYVGASRLAETAFGVANQSVHEYILALPESPNATSCTVQYVYNLQTQTWVRWTIPNITSGAVHPDTGQLYFGRTDGTLWIERKAKDNTDFQDPGFSIASPTATQTASLVFSGDLRTGATPFAVGDIVQQWQAVKALAQRVIAVSYKSSSNQTTVTLDKAPSTAWNQVVNLTIVKAVQPLIRFLPLHAGEPLTNKNWENCYIGFRYCDLDFMQVGYSSELYPITSTAIERINNADGSANAPVQLETWGSKAWGTAIWGKQAKDIIIKCTMPQEFDHSAQLTLTLSLPCALQRFELNAIDVKIAGASDRVVR